jgi:hypothetical protein
MEGLEKSRGDLKRERLKFTATPTINGQTLAALPSPCLQDQLRKAFATDDSDLQIWLIAEAVSVLSKGGLSTEAAANIMAAGLHDLKPSNPLETMLIIQIIALNQLGMQYLGRAIHGSRMGQESDTSIRLAMRITQAFANHLETLTRMRGQSNYTMAVGKVHVADGGQAVIGQLGR